MTITRILFLQSFLIINVELVKQNQKNEISQRLNELSNKD